MRRALYTLVTVAVALAAVHGHADIFRADNGQVIPGTEGITLGPGVDLSGWNSDAHNLRYGKFSKFPVLDVLDLTGANFSGSWLDKASFFKTNLTDADLSGAVVAGAGFGDTTSRGFTQAQLASTASYGAKDLHGIHLGYNDLSSWDFSGQNLTDAFLHRSTLTGANLSGAVVQ